MNPCYLIAHQIHRFRSRNRQPANLARRLDLETYWHWQYETSPRYFDKFFDLKAQLKDSSVVDIGCGLGGRTCFLADAGANRVIGIDINQAEIAQAKELVQRAGSDAAQSRVYFQTVRDLNNIANPEQFDVALLVDSLEHVENPMQILNQAYALLKPGGICYFSTWGWYHHQASHVGSIIPIPFSTLLFSDKQILDAVRKVVDQPYYKPTMWDTNPPSLRWKGCNSLHDRPGEYLNKYTIRRFRRSMAASDFDHWELRPEGFSRDGHPALALFNFLSRVPFIQEVFHSALFGRLVKVDAAQPGIESMETQNSQLRQAG